MPALSTTPVAIPAGSKLSNTGSAPIFFDRQSAPTTVRHIGHIAPGADYTASDDIYIVALQGDTSYTLNTLRSNLASSIAYAEATAAQNLLVATAGAYTDVTGLQIVVPAGSGPYMLESYIPALLIQGGASNVAGDTFNVHLVLQDEGGVNLVSATAQIEMAAANKAEIVAMLAKKKMPNPTSDKTIKSRLYWSPSRAGIGNLTLYNGPGTSTGAPSLDSGPAYIEAVTR